MRPSPQRLAAGALVVLSLASTLVGLEQGRAWNAEHRRSGLALDAQLEQYRRLDQVLAGRQAIGFFFERPRPEGPHDEFFVAQYALAPIRVRERGRHSLNLGVFESEAVRDRFIFEGNLHFVRGVSSRVALFERAGSGRR